MDLVCKFNENKFNGELFAKKKLEINLLYSIKVVNLPSSMAYSGTYTQICYRYFTFHSCINASLVVCKETVLLA